MGNEVVLLNVENHVGMITLNRPETGNAINFEVARQFLDVALECSENEDIRAVVLTGAGDKFCVGGDLKSFLSVEEEIHVHVKSLLGYFHQGLSLLARMNKPLIGAINGVAAGAGMSLACACDLVYSVEDAKFLMAYNRIGFTPDGSGSYFLPRIVGMRRALELLYTNRALDAIEAKEWGLVNEVVPKEALFDVVNELAERLAKGPINAYAATKKLLAHSIHETYESQLALEAEVLSERVKSAEAQEGIAAFLEKREANFLNK